MTSRVASFSPGFTSQQQWRPRRTFIHKNLRIARLDVAAAAGVAAGPRWRRPQLIHSLIHSLLHATTALMHHAAFH